MNRAEILSLPRDDPRYIEHMRAQLLRLPWRTVREMIALHYLVGPERVTCLDFNLSGPNIPTVDAMIESHVNQIGPNVVPDRSPDDLWMKLASLPQTSEHILLLLNRTLRLRVSVHSET